MRDDKKQKLVADLTTGINHGIPGYFGIMPNEQGDGYVLCSKRQSYPIMRLSATFVNGQGQRCTYDNLSKNFYCCLRQGGPKKPKKDAFVAMNENEQCRFSSKDDWVDADIYVQAIPSTVKSGMSVIPLAVWGHFRKRPNDDSHIKNRVVAVSTDLHLVWLLDTLADNIFNPMAEDVKNDVPAVLPGDDDDQ